MKRRPMLSAGDDELDPTAGLVNLFDVAMVFTVALMVALVNYLSLGDLLSGDDITLVKNPGTPQMEVISRQDGELVRYQASASDASSQAAQGERVGTAYRLPSGEIIYVPDR